MENRNLNLQTYYKILIKNNLKEIDCLYKNGGIRAIQDKYDLSEFHGFQLLTKSGIINIDTSKEYKDFVTAISSEYNDGFSLAEIGQRHGGNRNSIARLLRKNNIRIHSKAEGTLRWHIKHPHAWIGKTKNFPDNMDVHRGPNNGRFKGVGQYSSDGVWLYRAPSGYLRRSCKNHPLASKCGWLGEHVYQAAKKWGADYVKGKEVHHINGIKDDNRPENLLVVSKKDHRRIEKNFFLHRHNGGPTSPENIKSVLVLEMLHFDYFRKQIIDILEKNGIFNLYLEKRNERLPEVENRKQYKTGLERIKDTPSYDKL